MVNQRLPPPLISGIVQISIQALFTLMAGLWVIRTRRVEDTHPRIHLVAFLTLAAMTISCLLHDAWVVGAISYPGAVRFPVDAMHIASGAYLAILLWRCSSPSTTPPAQLRRMGIPT